MKTARGLRVNSNIVACRRTRAAVNVDQNGLNIIGDAANEPSIAVDPTNPDPLSVTESGELSQGNEAIGALRLVEFDDLQSLKHANGGYFTAGPGDPGRDAEASRVRQGFLESSNVSPVMEMANMISAMRGYEGNQRLIQTENQRMDNAIRTLAGNG